MLLNSFRISISYNFRLIARKTSGDSGIYLKSRTISFDSIQHGTMSWTVRNQNSEIVIPKSGTYKVTVSAEASGSQVSYAGIRCDACTSWTYAPKLDPVVQRAVHATWITKQYSGARLKFENMYSETIYANSMTSVNVVIQYLEE